MQALQKLVRFGAVGQVTCQVGGCDSLLPANYQTHERLLAQVPPFTLAVSYCVIVTAAWFSRQKFVELDMSPLEVPGDPDEALVAAAVASQDCRLQDLHA